MVSDADSTGQGVPVKLSDLAVEMDILSDEAYIYLERKTGKFFHITEEVQSMAEDEDSPDDHADWFKDDVEVARRIAADEPGYVGLPDKWDIDTYSTMRRFSLDYEDVDLCSAIEGRGAFHRFKDLIHRLGIQDKWYAYKDAELRTIARDWCAENDVPYVED